MVIQRRPPEVYSGAELITCSDNPAAVVAFR